MQGGNGQFFISSDGTAAGSAFTNGASSIQIGNGNNYVNLGAGGDYVQVGNGNNTISTGAGNDSIVLGGGANTVTGGLGADLIFAGGTGLTSLYTAIGQTGINNSTGSTIFTDSFDHYFGTLSGYKINFAGAASGFAAGASTSTISVAGVNNGIVFVRGDESIINSGGVDVDQFTANATGKDTLVVFDTDASAGTRFESFVINGQWLNGTVNGTEVSLTGGQASNIITATQSGLSYNISTNSIVPEQFYISVSGKIISTVPGTTVVYAGSYDTNNTTINASGVLGAYGVQIKVSSGNSPNLSRVIGSGGNDFVDALDVVGPLTVLGGNGADLIGAGNNSITTEYSAVGQTGQQNSSGSSVATAQFDHYQNFGNDDKISFAGWIVGFSAGVKNSSSSVVGNPDAVTFVQGTEANGSFVADPTGTDTLVVYDTQPSVNQHSYEAFVLNDGIFTGSLNGSVLSLVSIKPPSTYKITGTYSGTEYAVSSSSIINGVLTVSGNDGAI